MKALGLIGTTIAAIAAVLAGCASTSGARSEPTTSAATPPAHEHGMGMMGDTCPMQVAGTTVTPADVEGGVALVFTTGSASVVELRQRVRRMAEMHDQRGASGGMRMGGGMMMPAATATVEDIEGGARLVLRPKNPAQLEALREHARMRAGRMARGECPLRGTPLRQ
jgi:hypothetical protein